MNLPHPSGGAARTSASLLPRLIAGMSVLLLSACSLLQTVYEQAPRYLQWRTNVAHHLSAPQYDMAKSAIGQWFAQHRREHMPRIAELLAQAAVDVRGEVSPALACERRDAYLALAKQGVAWATPLAASVMVHLGPAQQRRVQAFFADINDDFRKSYVAEEPDQQARLAVAFLEKWGSWIYGDFTAAQRERLAQDVQTLPFSARTVLSEFERFQMGYVTLLAETRTRALTPTEVSQRLQALVLDGIDPQEPARKAQMTRWVQAGCGFASRFQGLTTPPQRERAASRLSRWQADVQEIARRR